MNISVQYDPFAPVAELERKIEALTVDNTSLCDLVAAQSLMLADKCRQIALLEEQVARLKRPGVYHLKQPPAAVGRQVLGGKR